MCLSNDFTIACMSEHVCETTGPQRLVYGFLAGLLTFALPLPWGWQFRCLLAWSVGVALYLVLSWWLCLRLDARQTREWAQAQDEPSVLLLLVLLLANLACVAAIAVLIQQSRDLAVLPRLLHIGLAVVALALSWLFIQAIFTFRYAHRYCQRTNGGESGPPGLQFPGGQEPDFSDFLYYAHVVGMTSQVSDVQVISRQMRRLTLLHSVLSFGFNMLVVALGINVVAGLLQ